MYVDSFSILTLLIGILSIVSCIATMGDIFVPLEIIYTINKPILGRNRCFTQVIFIYDYHILFLETTNVIISITVNYLTNV